MTGENGTYCQVCGKENLEIISAYAKFARATSDSKPWPSGGKLAVCTNCGAIQKLLDARWIEEIENIYQNYDIYQQSAGAEQLIFERDGRSGPRSKKLVNHIREQLTLPPVGKLLDIGCGNGAALRSFSEVLPSWALYGSELSAATIKSLQMVPRFAKLFLGKLTEIGERFELISIIHTLEHVLSPLETLKEAANLLSHQGVLFIEVPDVETSPFDLLVADHLLHFSRDTLRHLLERAGFQPISLSNDVLPKEITTLARQTRDCGVATPSPVPGIRLANDTVAWLAEVVALLQSMANQGPVGIFGTAIAGMALYGAIRDSVPFFVDEDPNRIGRSCDGKPIVAPANVPREIPIFLAFPPTAAQLVASRCRRIGINCILPPRMSEIAVGTV